MKIRSRKNRDGSTSWLMDYRILSKRYREVLSGVRTRAEAQRAAEELWSRMNARVRAGQAPHAEGEVVRTLGELLARHVERTGIEPTTKTLDVSHSKPLIRIIGADTPITAITGAVIERYKSVRSSDIVPASLPPKAPEPDARRRRIGSKPPIPRRGPRKVSPRTVNIELTILRAALNAAVEQGVVAAMPCVIRPMPTRPARPYVLSVAELERMAELAGPSVWKTILFLANTGLRKSEFYRLRWSDVAEDLSHVLVQTVKRGSARDIRIDPLPLNAVAKGILQKMTKKGKRPPASKLVFGIAPEDRPRGGAPKENGVASFADANINRKLKLLARDAGVRSPERVSLHVLRHSFATHTHARGASIKDTSALLRHRSMKLTMDLYAHEQWEGMTKAVAALEIGGLGHKVVTREKRRARK